MMPRRPNPYTNISLDAPAPIAANFAAPPSMTITPSPIAVDDDTQPDYGKMGANLGDLRKRIFGGGMGKGGGGVEGKA